MSSPTREDAQLLIQLAQWASAMGFSEAMSVIFDERFDPDTADVMDKPMQTMLMLGETIGTLVKHDLLSAELVHDWLWVEGVWKRVGPAALREREKRSEPRLYENFEALAAGAGAHP